MKFLLQRDASTALVRRVSRVQHHAAQHRGDLFVSALTVTSLELWLTLAQTPSRYMQTYAAIMQDVEVLPVDEAVAHRAAGIGTRLRLDGRAANTVDLFIAATALVHGLTLVTHGTQSYMHIPGLNVMDWTRP